MRTASVRTGDRRWELACAEQPARSTRTDVSPGAIPGFPSIFGLCGIGLFMKSV